MSTYIETCSIEDLISLITPIIQKNTEIYKYIEPIYMDKPVFIMGKYIIKVVSPELARSEIELLDHLQNSSMYPLLSTYIKKIYIDKDGESICILIFRKYIGDLLETDIYDDTIGIKIIESVKYMHYIGYYHGDIKPENICIDENCIKLIDYGLSRKLSLSLDNHERNTYCWFTPVQAVLMYFNRCRDNLFRYNYFDCPKNYEKILNILNNKYNYKKTYTTPCIIEDPIYNDLFLVAMVIIYIYSPNGYLFWTKQSISDMDSYDEIDELVTSNILSYLDNPADYVNSVIEECYTIPDIYIPYIKENMIMKPL